MEPEQYALVVFMPILIGLALLYFARQKSIQMTYKELLFKMADKGMLTLSTKKYDKGKYDRGLFWAGMNNIEALEQKVNLKEFKEHKKLK